MRIFFILTAIVLSSYQENRNESTEILGAHDFRVLQRRAATTTKKLTTTTPTPKTTTKKSTTTTEKPTWTISKPDIKVQLTTASQVFTTLGDIKKAQEYAEKYFKIQPLRLVSALKGVSIAAAIFAAFIDIPDPETEKILSNMNAKFDTMFKKMDSQTSELKSYIDQKFLNTFILAPVQTAEEGMNAYKKKPNAATKAAFLEKAKMAKLPEVVNHILLNTRDYLTNAMKNSRNNRSMVATMSGILVHSLHKACVIDNYRNGIEFKDQLLVERMNAYSDYFNNTIQKYKKISNEVFDVLESSFFPGYIEEDIIKPVLDENSGDSCQKSDAILKKLSESYPWREYAVIVADQPKSQFASYFGFPNRMIVLESYKERFVLVFMAMKEFKKKKDGYLAANERNTVTSEVQKAGINGVNKWVDFARNGKKYYQMTAFYFSQWHCLRQSNLNSIDAFTFDLTFNAEFFGPVTSPVNVVIVF